MSGRTPEPPIPSWFRYDVLLHDRCGRKLSEHPMPHAPAVSCPFPALPPREFATVETAPSPAAAGLPLEDVERVARQHGHAPVCICGPGVWATCDHCGADAWCSHHCGFPCDDVTCENGTVCTGCLTGRLCPVHNDDEEDW